MATKSYEHTGVCELVLPGRDGGAVQSVQPGSRFEAEIDPALESFLIEISGIKVIESVKPVKPIKPAEKKEL